MLITVCFREGQVFFHSALALKTLFTNDYHNIAAFELLELALPIGEMSNISIVIGNWLVNGLLVRMDSIPISMQNLKKIFSTDLPVPGHFQEY